MKPINLHNLRDLNVNYDDILNYLRNRYGLEIKPRMRFTQDWKYDPVLGHINVQHWYLEHAVGWYDYEKGHWRRCFAISNTYPNRYGKPYFQIYGVYGSNCVEQNLLITNRQNGRNYNLTDSLADVIYYGMFPPIFRYRNGELKRGFGGHLKRRIQGFASNTHMTQRMLDIANDSITSAITSSGNITKTQLICDKFNIPNRNLFSSCRFTNKIGIADVFKYAYFSDIRDCYHKNINPLDFGYVIDEDRSSHSSYYKLPHEVWVDEEYVDSNKVELDDCTDCGAQHLVENLVNHRCVRCAGPAYQIHNYSERVEDLLDFKASRVRTKNPLYFGIELEYESPRKMNKTRLYTGRKLLNHALMKHDGSLNNGVEVVSCPAEFDIHKPIYKSFLDDLPDTIQVSSRTGMHVHISRNALSPLQEGKIVDFMNRFDNQDFIRKIAMRPANSYQQRHSHSFGTVLNIRKQLNRGQDIYSPKYANLNLGKRHTLEFRVFSTPRTFKEFNIKMEFVKALVDFCQLSWDNIGIKAQTSWLPFTKWLNINSKSYTDLHNFCKEKSLCV